jgi:hypothetical protein
VNGAAEGPPHFAFAVAAAFAVAFAFTLAFAFAFAFPVVIPGEPALSEVEWGICLCLFVFAFFSWFLAQKSHVKPKNPPINPHKTHKPSRINHLHAKK